MTPAPISVSLAAPAPITLAVVGSDRPFPVRRIYCVGRNYLDHIREMKEADERDPPFFSKNQPIGGAMPRQLAVRRLRRLFADDDPR